MARAISVHVGLNSVDPTHYNGWDGALDACEADATAMEAIARSRGFETKKLLSRHATADAVIGEIETAAGELARGDIFFISYAGHGGQVPDTNSDEESDTSDETWLAFDRQIVDDELYVLWGKFQPGVRILVVSDSCHSGTVTRGITDEASVPDPVATAERAAQQSPRFRALPRETMIATYEQNQALYDDIQARSPSSASSASELAVGVLLISGCQDDELSRDGIKNGRFTEELLKVWDDGNWRGGYAAFHQAILDGMPADQRPSYSPVGNPEAAFEQQDPFTV
jgi:metacaspase-1